MAKPRRSGGHSPSQDELSVCHPNAGGIDIGAKSIYVAVAPNRAEAEVRAFGTMTKHLIELASWLEDCAVDTVAMEATGVYWIPLYEILEERGINVHVVNAHHVKTVPGRKSDVLDCQWLLRLHRFGLLQSSFRPTAEIVELREYLRQHHNHVKGAGSQVQRMQKALTLMNLQLHNVISDITGDTGMAIIRAVVAGEHDPKVLAEFRNHRCKASKPVIEASLTGNYRKEHLFTLRQALELYDHYQRLGNQCHNAADALLQSVNASPDAAHRPPLPKKPKKRTKSTPPVDYRTSLYQLSGVDLTDVPGFSEYTAATLLSEIGTDMTRWPTVKHFTSWLRLTPRTTITGGKHKDRRKLPTTNRASEIFRRAALCASRTKTLIGAVYRRFAQRPDRAMHAIAATAHKLARIVYCMLKDGVPYQEQNIEEWNMQHRDRAIKALKKRAKAMGMELVELLEQA